MSKKIIFATLFLMIFGTVAYGQKVALKGNLLYGGVALTPNLGLEFGLGEKSTLDLSGGYNPWNRDGDKDNGKKMVHWLGQVEYRYWLCERFNGHFFGVHALGSQYNIAGYDTDVIFPLFGDDAKNYRHEGWAAGGGISYGYQWILSKRWSLEATIGGGYAYMDYDRFGGAKCDAKVDRVKQGYWGVTRAGLSLVFVIK